MARLTRAAVTSLHTRYAFSFAKFLSSFDARPGDVDLVLDLGDVVYEHLAADELAVVGVLASCHGPTSGAMCNWCERWSEMDPPRGGMIG